MAHVSIDDALAWVLEGVLPLETEHVPIADALGRVLTHAICADRDQPPFDRAMMDGFAVRAEDVPEGSPPVTLTVVGDVPAGASFEGRVGSGECLRIMTGAPVPPDCDAVQMIENTEPRSDGTVVIRQGVRPRQHIADRGQDIRAGEPALPPGTRMTAPRLGLCWSFGARTLPVVRRPRVVILATGDELVPLEATPGPTQIRDSNRCSVTSLVQTAGADVVHTAIVPDTLEATRLAIRSALDQCDVLFLSGGVSAGDYDFVGPALEAEGVSRVFHKVHMKPGKPLWYGRRDQQHVFGLPGNPSSSVVTARLFAAPLLRALCGNARVLDPTLMLPLIEGFRGTRDRPTFQPAVIEWGTGVRLLSTHGSGDKRNFAGGTALAKLPANRDRFEAGDLIEVLLDEDTLRG